MVNKIVFYVPKIAPSKLLLKLSGLWSIDSEVDPGKLLFLGRLLKLQLHDAIYRLRFYSNSLTHILSLSNLHSNVASLQKNRVDKSYLVIVALMAIKWHLLSVIFYKSGLKAILMLTLFLWGFCQVYVKHCTNMGSSVILTHGSQKLYSPMISLFFCKMTAEVSRNNCAKRHED